MFGKGLCRPRTFMDIEIVEDHHVAGFQARRQLSADISIEGRAVHGAVDNPGSDQSIAAQPRDEGLRVPLAEGRIGHEPFSPEAAPAQRRHVGLHARLVEEDKPRRLAAHEGLAKVNPCPARRFDVRAFLLRGQQRFFYR